MDTSTAISNSGLTKIDSKMLKGLAALFMVMLHLFDKIDPLPYTSIMYIGNKPIEFYISDFMGCCVGIFAFCSGYAFYLLKIKEGKTYYKKSILRLIKLMGLYWTIVVLSSVISIILGNSSVIPNDFNSFILNFFAISNSYNGAWWYIFTYILMVLLFPLFFQIVQKINPVIITLFFLFINTAYYFVATKHYIPQYDNIFINWAITQIMNFLKNIFPYVFGMICYKYNLVSKAKDKLSRFSNFKSNLIVLLVFSVTYIAYTFFIHNSIVFPLTCIITALCFSFWVKPNYIIKIFCFLGEYSTGIWLTHMFFINIVNNAKFTILIFILEMLLSIVASYIATLIYNLIQKSGSKVILFLRSK